MKDDLDLYIVRYLWDIRCLYCLVFNGGVPYASAFFLEL